MATLLPAVWLPLLLLFLGCVVLTAFPDTKEPIIFVVVTAEMAVIAEAVKQENAKNDTHVPLSKKWYLRFTSQTVRENACFYQKLLGVDGEFVFADAKTKRKEPLFAKRGSFLF